MGHKSPPLKREIKLESMGFEIILEDNIRSESLFGELS
jgi:hypothetical protein